MHFLHLNVLWMLTLYCISIFQWYAWIISCIPHAFLYICIWDLLRFQWKYLFVYQFLWNLYSVCKIEKGTHFARRTFFIFAIVWDTIPLSLRTIFQQRNSNLDQNCEMIPLKCKWIVCLSLFPHWDTRKTRRQP